MRSRTKVATVVFLFILLALFASNAISEASSPPGVTKALYPGADGAPGNLIEDLTPTLHWTFEPRADYYALAISQYPYGTTNIIYNPQRLTGTSHAVPPGVLQPGIKYRWNLQAGNAAGWSAVSNTLYFQTQGEAVSVHNTPPGVTKALDPGISLSPGSYINNLTPTMQWTHEPRANCYALAISKYPYGTENIIYNPQRLTGTSHTVSPGVLEPGVRYRWNLQAGNNAGWGPVSNTLYFFIDELMIQIILDGRLLVLDVPPIIQEGRALVPFRAIGEALGATVNWDSQTQTVIMSLDGTTVSLRIGDMHAYVNGQQVSLDVPALIINGRTMVPLRFVSEALGAEVSWDSEARQVIIRYKETLRESIYQRINSLEPLFSEGLPIDQRSWFSNITNWITGADIVIDVAVRLFEDAEEKWRQANRLLEEDDLKNARLWIIYSEAILMQSYTTLSAAYGVVDEGLSRAERVVGYYRKGAHESAKFVSLLGYGPKGYKVASRLCLLDDYMIEGLTQGWDEATKSLAFRLVMDKLIDASGILHDSAVSDEVLYNNLRYALSDQEFASKLALEFAAHGLITEGIGKVTQSALSWVEEHRKSFVD